MASLEQDNRMKIFISHSSKNAAYGNALVTLLRAVGVKAEDIVFTSNPAYGIPIGKSVFQWLKNRIREQSYVIYLLSEEYYASVACLNEMGAAWVIENKGAMLFIPGFDLNCHEFQSGALDPRTIGFFLSDEDRVTEFVESLKGEFPILDRQVLINQAIKTFLDDVRKLSTGKRQRSETAAAPVAVPAPSSVLEEPAATTLHPVGAPNIDKYLSELSGGKLKDADVMLIWYAVDQGRAQLMTGWQEEQEVASIRAWEEVNGYPPVLSSQYGTALRRLEMRKLVAVSQKTSSGNAKEMRLIDPFVAVLTDQHDDINSHVQAVIQRLQSEGTKNTELPF